MMYRSLMTSSVYASSMTSTSVHAGLLKSAHRERIHLFPQALVMTPHQTSGTISVIGSRAMKCGSFFPGNEATAFAKAMTQHEFGRFYWDERRQNEMRLSLARAKARVRAERRARARLEKRKK